MHTRHTLLASTAFAALASAFPAQAATGWYVNVSGGANWTKDHSFVAATGTTVSADTLTWATSSDTGFVVSAALGFSLRQVMPGLRTDIEIGYRENSADGIWTSNTGTPTFVSSGTIDFDQTTFSVLANLWYDFDLGGVTPYVGGGIGWADTKLEGTYVGGVVPAFSFSDSGFAWQLGAGVNIEVAQNVLLGVGYRYFDGADVTVAPSFAANATTKDLNTASQSALVTVTFKM